MITVDEMKSLAARQAVRNACLTEDKIVGIGTGSTVAYVVEELFKQYSFFKFMKILSSSSATTQLLKNYGVVPVDPNSVSYTDVYIDGADEVDYNLHMIKGGGGALTYEKIIAAMSHRFICVVDQSKYVSKLCTAHPLPVEVIPMSRSYVARQIVLLGGVPNYRQNLLTDSGNVILDVYNLPLTDIFDMNNKLNNIAGVVAHGMFVVAANELIIGRSDGTVDIKKPEICDML
jgi:ribose 5-phosphate isomerase A